jgi:hypothetical protein
MANAFRRHLTVAMRSLRASVSALSERRVIPALPRTAAAGVGHGTLVMLCRDGRGGGDQRAAKWKLWLTNLGRASSTL